MLTIATCLSISKYVCARWLASWILGCQTSSSSAASSNDRHRCVVSRCKAHRKTLWTVYERNNPLVSNTIQANYRGWGPSRPTGINVRVKLTARQPGWLPRARCSPFIIFPSLLQLARTLILASLMRLCYFSPYPWQLDHRQPRRRFFDSCKPILRGSPLEPTCQRTKPISTRRAGFRRRSAGRDRDRYPDTFLSKRWEVGESPIRRLN